MSDRFVYVIVETCACDSGLEGVATEQTEVKGVFEDRDEALRLRDENNKDANKWSGEWEIVPVPLNQIGYWIELP